MKSILIVVTSYGEPIKPRGSKTGAYISELSHPYFHWKGKYKIDIASTKGGEVTLDESSLKPENMDEQTANALKSDKELMNALKHSKKVSEVSAKDYDAIFFVGGHGTVYDFPDSREIQEITRQIFERGGIVSAVCHGPSALGNVKLSNGEWLVKGKRITSFTNKEDELVGVMNDLPLLPENLLRERGAKFECSGKPFGPFVIVDGQLITGQNPASALGVAEALDQLLAK